MSAETTYHCDGPGCEVTKTEYVDLHGWIQVATMVDSYEQQPRMYKGVFHDVSCLVEWSMVEEDRSGLDEMQPHDVHFPGHIPGNATGMYL